MPAGAKIPPDDATATIVAVRIDLLGSDPAIWREVEVPVSITLADLHAVIQVAMPWQDYHLWEFTVGKARYGLPMEEDWGTAPRFAAAKTRLGDVLKPQKTRIDYTYDFGDGWEHRLTLTKPRPAEPGTTYPRYVAGAMNAPPEDSGGLWGFYDKLEIVANEADPDHAEIAEWLGDYDPAALDEAAIRRDLAALAIRLSKPKKAGRKKTG